MTRHSSCHVSSLLLLFLWGYVFQETVFSAELISADVYSVGVAKVDVTPDYPVRLSGFGFRREESNGVLIPIHARAIAISELDGKPLVFIAVDSTGLSEEIVQNVADQLGPLGVSRDQLVIAATHSHTAPMIQGVLPTLFGMSIPPEHQKHIKRYTEELIDKLVQVAQMSIEAQQPSRLWWGTGHVGFSKNRRDSEKGPIDQGLPVLCVRSESGELKAVIANYACHAVTLSHNLIGGDWPGFASEWLEKRHPDAIVLMSIGCGADQNPIPGVTGDNVDIARSQGLEIAQEVDRVLNNALRPVAGSIHAATTDLSLPLEPLPTRTYWEERVKLGKYFGYHAQTQLDILDAGGKLPTSVDYKIQSWTFGDSLAMVFLPGEVVVDYAIELRKRIEPTRLWITAYANDCPCYIPSERVLAKGGYEGETSMTYYNKPAKFAAGLEQKILDTTQQIVPASFHLTKSVKNDAGLPPLSPTQSLNRLKIPEGWTAQTVAAEPLTTDPVAIDFGPSGELWVCEMHDYPSGVAGNFEAGGKVRLLRDANRDGIYDSSTVFLDGLPFPTGVTVWRDGVLICAAPDIIFAKDNDGDDIADERTVLFTGFGTENYQARVNSLTYGLDGWVYGSCGLFGGEILCQLTGVVVPLGNRDFRINPDTGTLEPLTGRSQQGRVRNDAGDWFGCSNGQPCWHYPILKDDTRPALKLPPLITSVPTGDARQLFPETAEFQRFKLSGPAGRVTAGCGIGIYRDNWLGEDLSGNSIVCEPVNLLLHRRVLKADGLTFKGDRAPGEEASELVTSTDNWFRPVQMKTGPDGGLWISDMSRAVVEHPRWIPAETLAQLDVRAGDQQGRIIRLLPKMHGARQVPVLSQMNATELVSFLSSENGTQRDLAQQLLLWNVDQAAVEPLINMIKSDFNPAGKAAALWILAEYGAVTDEVLTTAMQNPSPLLRRQAVRVTAEHHDQLSDPAGLLDLLDQEQNLFVVAELIEAIRRIADSKAAQRLDRLYLKHSTNRHLQFLILRAVPESDWSEFVEMVVNQPNRTIAQLVPLVSISLTTQNESALRPLLMAILVDKPSLGMLSLTEQIAKTAYENPQASAAWFTPDVKSKLASIIAQSRKIAIDPQASQPQRLVALNLLGLEPAAKNEDHQRLLTLLDPQTSSAIQQRVISVLARMQLSETSTELIARLDTLSPTLVNQILDLLLSRPDSTVRLMSAIERAEISANVLNAARRDALLQHPDNQIRLKSEKLLRSGGGSPREKVIDQYRSALQLTGNPQRAVAVYQKQCANCHKYGDQGYGVGPDFGESRNKSWSQLLNSVLDPSQTVDQRYAAYVVATVDGRVIQGMLAAESQETITIAQQQAKQTVIPRDEIEVLKRTDRSVMPEGLEKELSAQDLADLFSLITERNNAIPSQISNLPEIAAQLLDDSRDRKDREKILAENLTDSSGLIRELLVGLPVEDMVEQYRRIPWIWRVSIAVGKANQAEDLRSVLDMSLPAIGEPLQDWQTVVIGGGVINGITQAGDWPHERMEEIFGNDRDLRARWKHALQQAVVMSDQLNVKPGTRYDALRMVSMRGWSGAGAQLTGYLSSNDQQLQMGAVSGLADIPEPPAVTALISCLPQLTEKNRKLALEGLLRSEERIRSLLESCVEGNTSVDLIAPAIRKRLSETENAELKKLALQVLGSI